MGSSGPVRGEAAALKQHGQRLYQQGDFKGAINAFTEALKVKDIDVVGVLDVRAATYTKLTQYDLALRDARQMIKKEKNDERGYLRCAKALLLDGKPSKAFEVYAYALKTLGNKHPRYQLVERLHDKLQDKLSEKCLDPFTVLPLEMAHMILQNFDFKQIVAILRVSRKWEQFLSSIRHLWMRIDFSGGRGKIPWTSVRAYIRRSKAMLTHAIIKDLATPSVQKSLELLSRCPKLEYLEVWPSFNHKTFYDLFKGCKQLKALVTSREISLPQEHITKFLSGMPLLERIEVHSARASPLANVNWPPKLTNLKILTLGSREQSPSIQHVSALHIPGLLHPADPHCIPNLEELRLSWNPPMIEPYPLALNPSSFSKLRRLDLSGVRFIGTFGLPSSLEYLRIFRGTGVGEFPFSIENQIELPNLKTLILNDVPWVTFSTLQIFLAELAAPIQVLGIDLCTNIQASQLELLTKSGRFEKLVEFNASHISGIDDRIAGILVSNMPNLKALGLSFTRITGVTVKMLADAYVLENDIPKLERIHTQGCEELSFDAVAYARAKGIDV